MVTIDSKKGIRLLLIVIAVIISGVNAVNYWLNRNVAENQTGSLVFANGGACVAAKHQQNANIETVGFSNIDMLVRLAN